IGNDTRQFTLRRYKINCCAADSVPLNAIIVVKGPQELNLVEYANKWVQVTGKIQFLPKKDGREYVTAVVLTPHEKAPLSALAKTVRPAATPYANGPPTQARPASEGGLPALWGDSRPSLARRACLEDPMSLQARHRPLLEAISFAARAHQGQMRKDRVTPYAAHPFRVCTVLQHVFGIHEPAVLTAGVLHDTVEDTTTDRDDIIEKFGPEVAEWVALLSKDKRLPDDAREEAYRAALDSAPWQVKVCKLADIFDNMLDSQSMSPAARKRTLARSRAYLAVLNDP